MPLQIAGKSPFDSVHLAGLLLAGGQLLVRFAHQQKDRLQSMMRPPLPSLDDYGISIAHGFLPSEIPLEVLSDPYYAKWEAIVRNLQGLILSRRLRGVVDGLPILSTARLGSEASWRRAYSMLAFITHAYIWGGDGPAEVCDAHFPQSPI